MNTKKLGTSVVGADGCDQEVGVMGRKLRGSQTFPETARGPLVRRPLQVGGAIFILVLIALAMAARAQAQGFDYAMDERFGTEPDGTSKIFYYNTPADIDPGSFGVTFTCDCGAAGSHCGTVKTYEWTCVRGCNTPNEPFGANSCTFWTNLKEGTYQVGLTLTTSDDVKHDQVVQQVVIQDFLIVAVGDSYGSGEGNPDVRRADLSQVYQDWKTAQDTLNQELSDKTIYDDLISCCDNVVDNSSNKSTAAVIADCFIFHAAKCNDQKGAVVKQIGQEFVDWVQGTFTNAYDAIVQAIDAARTALNGASDKEIQGQAQWQNEQCRRSAFSGQARAAIALEQSDPHSSVTFVHLACSGATIHAGVLGEYKGNPEKDSLPSQLDQIKSLVGTREIDALLMSIGGNDARFADIIKGCMFREECYDNNGPVDVAFQTLFYSECNLLDGFLTSNNNCDTIWNDDFTNNQKALDAWNAGEPTLAPGYADLDTALVGDPAFTELGSSGLLEKSRVYITGYPTVVFDDDGNICLGDKSPSYRNPPGLAADELIWANDTVAQTLNADIASAATAHSWHFIDMSNQAQHKLGNFENHGYCASDAWFVRLLGHAVSDPSTFGREGLKFGAFHPNEEGHAEYAYRIQTALNMDLFDAHGAPRKPIQPPIAVCATGAAAQFPADELCQGRGSVDAGSYAPDESGPVECSTSPPPPYFLGSTSVTLTCSDGSLSASCATQVQVVDLDPPRVTCPGDKTVECQRSGQVAVHWEGEVNAHDNCTRSVSAVCTPASGFLFPVSAGTPPQAVTCAAVDQSNNRGSCEFAVRVVDTVPPDITCPPPVTVECEGNQQAVADPGQATATDACTDPQVAQRPGGQEYPLGRTAVDYFARDEAGNQASCTTYVTVADTAPPAITCPADITVECTAATGGTPASRPEIQAFLAGATATDRCSGPRPVLNNAPALFDDGTTRVTFTATDTVGNAASCSANVIVAAGRTAKQMVATHLTALLPTGNRYTDMRIAEALKGLGDSLQPGLFLDDQHLNPRRGDRGKTLRQGEKVFDGEKQAIEALLKIKPPPAGVTTAIMTPVCVDRHLAQTAVNDAIAGKGKPDDIRQAQGELTKAQQGIAKGDFDGAVEHFKGAWGMAEHALGR